MLIEKNVPIPEATRNRYNFKEMLIGDSFLSEKRACVAASIYKSLHPGWDYRSITMPGGKVRIWRMA